LLVCFLSFETVSAVPVKGKKDNGSINESVGTFQQEETGTLMSGNENTEEAIEQLMKKLEKKLKDPYWQSKWEMSRNIKDLMKLAEYGVKFSPIQQLWLLELILNPWKSRLANQPKWIEIVKNNFKLTTEMYGICIRIIQNQKSDPSIKQTAAEFMMHMYKEKVPLPDSVKQKIVPFDVETIMDRYSLIDKHSSLQLIRASIKNNLQKLQELLQEPGINVNQGDDDGQTPLIWASRYGHLQIVQELLKQPGIDVNESDNDGNNALIWASNECRLEIVQELLQQPEMDVNKVAYYGSALKGASGNGCKATVQLLKEHIKNLGQ
jgi:hypothetical protein